MGGVGCAVGVDGVVGVAMVGDDDNLIAGFFSGFNSVLDTFVNSLNGFFDRFVDTGVSHHVAVGVVDNNKVIFLFVDGIDKFVAYFKCAHLGFEVVGGNLGRCNEDSFFTLVRSFASAIEEECHMGIFLCLRNVELFLVEA